MGNEDQETVCEHPFFFFLIVFAGGKERFHSSAIPGRAAGQQVALDKLLQLLLCSCQSENLFCITQTLTLMCLFTVTQTEVAIYQGFKCKDAKYLHCSVKYSVEQVTAWSDLQSFPGSSWDHSYLRLKSRSSFHHLEIHVDCCIKCILVSVMGEKYKHQCCWDRLVAWFQPVDFMITCGSAIKYLGIYGFSYEPLHTLVQKNITKRGILGIWIFLWQEGRTIESHCLHFSLNADTTFEQFVFCRFV